MNPEQQARNEAVKTAGQVLATKTTSGSFGAAGGSEPGLVDEVILLAEYIVTGQAEVETLVDTAPADEEYPSEVKDGASETQEPGIPPEIQILAGLIGVDPKDLTVVPLPGDLGMFAMQKHDPKTCTACSHSGREA